MGEKHLHLYVPVQDADGRPCKNQGFQDSQLLAVPGSRIWERVAEADAELAAGRQVPWNEEVRPDTVVDALNSGRLNGLAYRLVAAFNELAGEEVICCAPWDTLDTQFKIRPSS